MKIFRMVALVPTVLAFLCGCSTSQPTTLAGPRFHDGSQVNVVLQFSSWDYTFMVQPAFYENGFLQQVRRDNIGQIFNRLAVSRNLAVVVVGWTYESDSLQHVLTDWKTILGGCGFRRIVFLRPNRLNTLNGSLIIDDTTVSIGTDQAASRG